jgi:hypothetical protein
MANHVGKIGDKILQFVPFCITTGKIRVRKTIYLQEKHRFLLMMAIIPLTRKLSTGGSLNVPATSPFLIHPTTVFSLASLATLADSLFSTGQEPSLLNWRAGAPFLR